MIQETMLSLREVLGEKNLRILTRLNWIRMIQDILLFSLYNSSKKLLLIFKSENRMRIL